MVTIIVLYLNHWLQISSVNTEAACGTNAGTGIELDSDANRTQCLQRHIEDFRLTIDENGVLGERLLHSAVCCTCAVIANKRIKV